jgi:ribosome-binding factor A
VGAEITRVLAELLLRRSRDPRLALVTITSVDVTPDLRLARIAYSVLDDVDRREVQRVLVGATPFLRRGIAGALSLRYVPDLEFAYDTALEGARRVDSLLRSLPPPQESESSAEVEEGGAEPEAAPPAADGEDEGRS